MNTSVHSASRVLSRLRRGGLPCCAAGGLQLVQDAAASFAAVLRFCFELIRSCIDSLTYLSYLSNPARPPRRLDPGLLVTPSSLEDLPQHVTDHTLPAVPQAQSGAAPFQTCACFNVVVLFLIFYIDSLIHLFYLMIYQIFPLTLMLLVSFEFLLLIVCCMFCPTVRCVGTPRADPAF